MLDCSNTSDRKYGGALSSWLSSSTGYSSGQSLCEFEANFVPNALRPDRKRESLTGILLVSLFAVSSASVAQELDGAIDMSFGTAGRHVSDYGIQDFGYGAVATPSGNIVVVGANSDGTPQGRSAHALILDESGAKLSHKEFDNGPFGCSNVPEAFYAAALETTGTVLAGGFAQFDCGGPARDFWLIRMDQGGNQIQRFDRPVFHGVQENIWDLAIQADGKIVAAGFADTNPSDNTTRDIAVARYDEDGTLDTTGFGTNGEVLVDFAGGYDFAYAVAVQNDGSIVVGGFVEVSDQFDFLIVRLLSDGSRDSGFGGNGVVTTDFMGFNDIVNDITVRPDGKIIAVGSRGTAEGPEFVAARYNVDGSLDDSFGDSGVRVVDFGADVESARTVSRQYGCKLQLVGITRNGEFGDGTGNFAVARISSVGEPDPSFANDGQQIINVVDGQDDVALGTATQRDGKLILTGYTFDDATGEYDFATSRLADGNVLFADPFEDCP